MSKVKAFVGIGLANGVNVGTNTGTGDDAFTGYTDTPNWNTTIGGFGVSSSTEQDRAYWSFTALSAWVLDFEVYFDAALTPSGAKPITRLDSAAGATAICYLGVDTAGKLQFRNSSNVATLTAPSGPTAATWYRVVIFGSTASSSGSMWVGTPGVDPASNTNRMTGSNGFTTVAFGVTTQPNYVSFGKQDGTALNSVVRFKNLYVGNTAADAGTYPWPPGAPSGVGHGTATSSTMPLTWTAPSNVPFASVASYKVYKDGVQVSGAAPTTTSYTVTGLSPSTSYSWTVAAVDTNGNTGAQSAAHSASTISAGDTTAPSAPTALTHTTVTDTTVALSWTASSDDTAVTGYTVYRGATAIGTPTGTTYTATGLTPSTSYTFTVTAHDAVPNTSAASAGHTVSTLADNDRAWNGTGVADGTVVTTSLVGTGDDHFNTVFQAPVFHTATQEITLLNATQQYVAWNAFGFVTYWSVQFYLRFAAAPTATAPLFYLESGGARIGMIYTGSAGVLTLRDAAQGVLSTSPGIAVGEHLRVNVWGTGSTINVEASTYGTSNVKWSATGNKGSALLPDTITFGRRSSTPFGTDVGVSHMRVAERATAFLPQESVVPPTNDNVRTWDGPLVDDASISVGDGGVGDYPFDDVSGAVTLPYNAATGRITIPDVAGIGYVKWNSFAFTDGWSFRFRFRWEPDATVTLGYILNGWNSNTAGTKCWAVQSNPSKQLSLRNAANTAVQTSDALDHGVDYDLFIRGTSGSNLVKITVKDADGNVAWDPPATNITTTTPPISVQFGRSSSAQLGTALYLSHFASSDVNADIPLPEDLTPVHWYWEPAGGGTLQPLRILGWESAGGGVITPLRTIPTQETYTPPPVSVDGFLYPFAPESIWKHSVTDQTTYELATDPMTALFLNETVAGSAVNYSNWTYPMYKTDTPEDGVSDTIDVYTITYTSTPGQANLGWTIDPATKASSPNYRLRIPYNANWAGTTNNDRPCAIVDGITTIELYRFGWYRKADNSYAGNLTAAQRRALGPGALFVACQYGPVFNDIRGWGLDQGRQASGVSQLGGMVRKHEMAADVEIEHVIKGTAWLAQMRLPSGSTLGTIMRQPNNSSGNQVAVWPSRLSDNQVNSPYTGGSAGFPMGSAFAIPRSVDVVALCTTLGLDWRGLKLANALQRYGYRILVASATVAIYVEPGADTTVSSYWSTTAWPRLRRELRRIKNDYAGPAGVEGYLAADPTRLVPHDDSYIMGGGTRLRPIQPPLSQGVRP